MPNTENDPDLYMPQPEICIASGAIQRLGSLGIQEGSHDEASLPPASVEVLGVEPPHYAPAGARPYEGTAKRGIELNGSLDQAEQATAYAQSLFPESTFSYLGAGRHGVVLADETGKAYKVCRSALEYSRSEKEAGALQLLHEAGLAPKLHLFVDAGEEYRLDRKAHDYTQFGFEDVQIRRQNSGRELPVLVMDRVDVEPLENADPATVVDGFCKITELFMRENIHSWDTEVAIDKKTGGVIILDVGELFQKPFDEQPASPEVVLNNQLEILRSIAMEFGLSQHEYRITEAYRRDGLSAVRDLLAQLLGATS